MSKTNQGTSDWSTYPKLALQYVNICVAVEEVGLVQFFLGFLTNVLLVCKVKEFVIDLSNFVTASHNVGVSFHIIRFVWSFSSLEWSSSRTKWGNNVIIKFSSKQDLFARQVHTFSKQNHKFLIWKCTLTCSCEEEPQLRSLVSCIALLSYVHFDTVLWENPVSLKQRKELNKYAFIYLLFRRISLGKTKQTLINNKLVDNRLHWKSVKEI